MTTGLSNHEVVRISRQGKDHGFPVIQEFSFLIDHSIQMRLTSVEDNGLTDTCGWVSLPYRWAKLEKVMAFVLKKELSGWSVVWGREYGPEPTVASFLQMVEW